MVKVSLNVDVRRGVDWRCDLEPNMQLKLEFDKFQISMTQQHYKDILNMLNGNIWAVPPPKFEGVSTGNVQGVDSEKRDYLQFQTKAAKEVYSQYDRQSTAEELQRAIDRINDLIKNSAQSTIADDTVNAEDHKRDDVATLSMSKSMMVPNVSQLRPTSISIQRTRSEEDLVLGDDGNMNRHIIVDELMKLRVLYQQWLFNHCSKQTELDKVLSRLNRLEEQVLFDIFGLVYFQCILTEHFQAF